MHPFRQGLLSGRSIALSGAVPPEVSDLLRALDGQIGELDPGLAPDEKRLFSWAQATGHLDALVFQPGGGDDLLIGTWAAVRAVATEAFVPRGRGQIVLLAPGEERGAVAAALENLARTLSVEWARFEITTVAIKPGASTSDDEVAELVAFLCSPAGAYHSGRRFDLASIDGRPNEV
jgi:NAD(P)-dependent dehydrogenase (short-subunit alcohol dehydrogenase family)